MRTPIASSSGRWSACRSKASKRCARCRTIASKGYWPAVYDKAVTDGDGEAQDHVRKTIDLLCKLNGLNKPQKIEHSGEIEGAGTTVFLITPEDAKL